MLLKKKKNSPLKLGARYLVGVSERNKELDFKIWVLCFFNAPNIKSFPESI